MNILPKNVQIQFSGEGESGPTLQEELEAQTARGIRSGVVTRTPAKNATVTENPDGSLTTTPGERLSVETGITPVQASLDSLTKQINRVNGLITELQSRPVPTNRIGAQTTDPQRFAASIAVAVQRLERQRQPLLDARAAEYALAVARGDTNLYQADNPTLSDEALAELLVKSAAMDEGDIKTTVRSIPGGPITVEVMRKSDGDIALDYLSKS